MNNILVLLLKSLLVTTAVSSCFALGAHYVGAPSLFWFVTTFIGQIIAFYMFKTYLEYKAARDSRILLLKEAELVAKNTMMVECANCKKESEVVVDLSQRNRYTCGHCGTKNSIYIYSETAVVTEPKYESNPIPDTTSTNRQ